MVIAPRPKLPKPQMSTPAIEQAWSASISLVREE
jgi:hypothetical protein